MSIEPFNESISPLLVFLADDDLDDRFFFDNVLKTVPIETNLMTFDDGETLLLYLKNNFEKLPDVLFLDHNMPKKNGFECLLEIKNHPKLRDLPVVIHSTYLHVDVTDTFYDNGAHLYICKTDLKTLKKTLQYILTLIKAGTFIRPTRDAFILSMVPNIV